MPAPPLTEEWIEEQQRLCEEATREGVNMNFAVIALREGYPLVLKEVLRLKRVIYRAHSQLMEGESGHAVRILDDDREPASESYYD